MPAIRRAEMARAARDPRGRSTAGSASSTPGCPRATRCRRCPRGASRSVDLDEADRPAGRGDPRVPAARPGHLRREGGYPHPDHIMCHEITVAAFDAAGDPDRYPEAGRAVAAAQALLHHGFSRARMGPCTTRCWRAGSSRRTASGWRTGRPTGPDPGPRVTTRVQCADYFAVRDDALRAHATQIDPDGSGSTCRRPAARGLADRGLRARPLARRVPLPEDDLFAGIDVPAQERRAS